MWRWLVSYMNSIGIDTERKKRKKVKLLSRVQLFGTPWTVAHQAPLSMGFSRQEYWSGLPFPSLGDLPNPRTEPRSPALQADTLTSEPPWKPFLFFIFKLYIIVLVLPNIKMNPPQVYMCSPSWTLLPPPSPFHPLGRPSAPAPSIQYGASNLDWQLVSYMIFYMFQCHSPKSSHPLPLSQSP